MIRWRDQALVDAFAHTLRAKRNALNWSQERLAHSSGVNRTYIAKLELARNQPTLAVMYRLTRALGASLPEVIQETLARHETVRRSNRLRVAKAENSDDEIDEE